MLASRLVYVGLLIYAVCFVSDECYWMISVHQYSAYNGKRDVSHT